MTGGRGLALVTRYAGGLIAAIVVVLLVFLGVLEPLESWSLARFFEVRGSRLPVASSHSGEGPGRMRMPCRAQIGSQFWMPSV